MEHVQQQEQSSSTSSNVENTVQIKRKAGRKKFRETHHPVYKGVRRRNGKWVCELREPNKQSRVWLGTFSSPDMAARAYDEAALALRGESASLNFPDTVRARSDNIREIQCAVTETAAEQLVDDAGSSSSSSSLTSSLLSRCMESSTGKAVESSFLDEEELFNMPGILDSMAEGLILTPPSMKIGFNWDDTDEDPVDLILWSD